MEGTDLQSAIRGLGIGVALIALFLGLRQWHEQRARGEPTEFDRRFHASQAVRRWIGIAALALIAAMMFGGSWVEPRIGGKGNPGFVVLWTGILGLIAAMLGVAFWDAIATWRYAVDQRRDLARDHVEQLRGRLRGTADATRSHADDADEPPASSV